ncbi:ROK family protein [Streptomyces sp. NPDC054861]
MLRAVLDHGPVSRGAIARLSGLSPAAVSRQATDLAGLGLLRERPDLWEGGTVGRPQIPVDLHLGEAGGPVAGGVQIGVPGSTFGLVDLRGRVLARRALPHDGTDPRELPARIARALGAFLADHTEGRPLLGIGAALGGWVDPSSGVVVRHDALGWQGRPLAAELATGVAGFTTRASGSAAGLGGFTGRSGSGIGLDGFTAGTSGSAAGLDGFTAGTSGGGARLDGFTAGPGGPAVRIDNHARAIAQSEILFGRPAARRSLVHLFVGTVVDAAVGIAGVVHQGPGSAAGDVSHLPVPESTAPCQCGRSGCLEATASDTALGQEARRRGIVPEPDAFLVVDAAAAGDRRADLLLRERARAVGRAAALLLDVLNPDLLVVTEYASGLEPAYLDEIRCAALAFSHGCDDPERIVSPHAGPAVLPVAAGTVLLSTLFKSPFGHAGPSPTRSGE